MLKDINGQDNLTFYDGSIINNIDDILENLSFRYNLDELNIIGFVKFEPFIKTDNRFCNYLDHKSWYPIIKKKCEPFFLKIPFISETHFGLFSHIVAINEESEKYFTNFKNTNPRIKKYWNRKKKEQRNHEEYIQRMYIRIEKEKKELSLLKKELGRKPKRNAFLTSYLNNNLESKNFFNKLNDEKVKNQVIKDIEFRLKSIEISLRLKTNKSDLFHSFSKKDNRYEDQLNYLLSQIKNNKEKPFIKEIIEVKKDNFFHHLIKKFTTFFS